MRKKLLLIVFALVATLCCIFGLSACNTEDSNGEQNGVENLKFELNSDGLSYSVYANGTVTNLIIPQEYNGKPVTRLKGVSIDTTYTLKSVTIPESIKYINNAALAICYKLEEINYNAIECEDLQSDNNVFACAGLESRGIKLNIGANVKRIPAKLFFPHHNTRKYFPNLTTVYFKKGSHCESIGASVFDGCKNLQEVYISDISDWCNIYFENLYSNPLNYNGNLYLNEEPVGNLVLPENVKRIYDGAFYNCQTLTGITIPDGVTWIGAEAFKGCYNLLEANLPETLTGIRKSAFEESGITNLTIPESVSNIEENAFYHCYDLTEIQFNATSCDDFTVNITGVFGGCGKGTGLTVNIGVNVKKIPAKMFLNESGLEDNIIYVSNVCFNKNSVCETIGDFAFANLIYLSNINLPSSIKTIGEQAFFNCCSLVSITIPQNVSSIKFAAFCECVSLELINYNTSDVSYSPNSCVFYRAGMYGEGVTVNIGVNVKQIPAYIFYNSEFGEYGINIKSVEFAKGSICKSIGEYAFYNVDNLIEIRLPESVTAIGEYSFYYCKNLCNLSLGSIVNISDYAFTGCYSLVELNLSNSVKTIGEESFSGCGFKNLEIGKNVLSIGEAAFRYCTEMENLTITDSVIDIGNRAFSYCEILKEVIIGDGVENIGAYAFHQCTNVEKVFMGASVKNIGEFAFLDCYVFNGVYIKDVAAWCDINFANINANPLSEAFIGTTHRLYVDGEAVTTLIIPDGVKVIRSLAFYDFFWLENVIIPRSVLTIEDNVFINSYYNLVTVYYEGSEAEYSKIYKGNNVDYYYGSIRDVYFYIEDEASLPNDFENGNYWHYDSDGKTPKRWTAN